MDKREQILQLLGKGVEPSVICRTVEVSPSYISELKADPRFAEELKDMLVVSQLAATVRDEAYDELEDKLIDKLKGSLDFITNPMQIANALKTVNGLKRRGLVNAMTQQTSIVDQAVIVDLPEHLAQPQIKTEVNTTNEVIEVDGQPMITMPTQQVLQKLEQRKQLKLEGQSSAMENSYESSKEISYGKN